MPSGIQEHSWPEHHDRIVLVGHDLGPGQLGVLLRDYDLGDLAFRQVISRAAASALTMKGTSERLKSTHPLSASSTFVAGRLDR
ncbi:MAG: hypothetical protein HC927_02375 [Deltaproteobacteria bacterium]|nr:hypothetical protein [Deltaproteobacteria bacterium]